MQINESTSRGLINGLSGFKIVEDSLRRRTRCEGSVSSSLCVEKNYVFAVAYSEKGRMWFRFQHNFMFLDTTLINYRSVFYLI